MRRWPYVVLLVAMTALSFGSEAKPYVPEGDAVVLERLPEKGDPALAQLKRMRAMLATNPGNLEVAVPVARGALDAARTLGDPRFLGQAQAALARWWRGYDVPPVALLLRATVKQSQHDFKGSLADLDALLNAQPMHAQARLTRATVLGVLGRYVEASRDCIELQGRVAPIVIAGCNATPASLSGSATKAYQALVLELRRGTGNPDLREWALTLAAEIATRRGDFEVAERHFREARVLDGRDLYLKGAFADFLLDRGRFAEVVTLLRDDTKHDGLLLRLALAEQRLPEQTAAFAVHREDLTERFNAARRRGDSSHRREEARFRLAINNDPAAALKLARDNWAVQREPADLRIMIESACAAGDSRARKTASDWVAANHLEDASIVALLR